jgi:hypothetical protein
MRSPHNILRSRERRLCHVTVRCYGEIANLAQDFTVKTHWGSAWKDRMMHNEHVSLSTYAVVGSGCTPHFTVLGGNQVEVTFGNPADGFQFVMAAESLREFLHGGARALAEMEAHR